MDVCARVGPPKGRGPWSQVARSGSWALRGGLVLSRAPPRRSVGAFGSFVVLTLVVNMHPFDFSILKPRQFGQRWGISGKMGALSKT